MNVRVCQAFIHELVTSYLVVGDGPSFFPFHCEKCSEKAVDSPKGTISINHASRTGYGPVNKVCAALSSICIQLDNDLGKSDVS